MSVVSCNSVHAASFFFLYHFFFFIDAQKDFIERRSTSGTRFKIASRQKKKGGKKIKSETCADAVKWTKWPLCVAFFFCFYLCTRANDTYDVSFFFLLFVCITGLFIGYWLNHNTGWATACLFLSFFFFSKFLFRYFLSYSVSFFKWALRCSLFGLYAFLWLSIYSFFFFKACNFSFFLWYWYKQRCTLAFERVKSTWK